MVLLSRPRYRVFPPFNLGHIQTIFPTLLRATPKTKSTRKRIETPDGDFVDIDIHFGKRGESKKLAVISHGLEGSAQKKYVLGMAKMLTSEGFDAICLNFRGCSGEPNRLPRLYHSGVTDDLHLVVTTAIEEMGYDEIALVGFSMGGNQTLKYLGEDPLKVPIQVKAAVVFSVPCMLADSVEVMDSWFNRGYMRYFLKGLAAKVTEKAGKFPDLIDLEGLDTMKTFEPFDDKYTAPLHGFENAADYYEKCSSRQFLKDIQVPTLLVQALDDPFLSASCYPTEEAERSDFLYLEIPEFGGHVGFVGNLFTNVFWSEKRAVDFFQYFL